jgi:hypothetical protein
MGVTVPVADALTEMLRDPMAATRNVRGASLRSQPASSIVLAAIARKSRVVIYRRRTARVKR